MLRFESRCLAERKCCRAVSNRLLPVGAPTEDPGDPGHPCRFGTGTSNTHVAVNAGHLFTPVANAPQVDPVAARGLAPRAPCLTGRTPGCPRFSFHAWQGEHLGVPDSPSRLSDFRADPIDRLTTRRLDRGLSFASCGGDPETMCITFARSASLARAYRALAVRSGTSDPRRST
jgi:hypothetical protein